MTTTPDYATQAKLIATLVTDLAMMGEHSESGSRIYTSLRRYAAELADHYAESDPRFSRKVFLQAAGFPTDAFLGHQAEVFQDTGTRLMAHLSHARRPVTLDSLAQHASTTRASALHLLQGMEAAGRVRLTTGGWEAASDPQQG